MKTYIETLKQAYAERCRQVELLEQVIDDLECESYNHFDKYADPDTWVESRNL